MTTSAEAPAEQCVEQPVVAPAEQCVEEPVAAPVEECVETPVTTPAPELQCSQCPATFSRPFTLQRHMESVHKGLECAVCFRSFTDLQVVEAT